MALHHHDNVDIGGLKMKRVELINDHFSTYFTTVRNLIKGKVKLRTVVR
jgi:hypothetical protein